MRRIARRLSRSDEGVTEVIGYVLSFALSAIFLLIALNVFHASRDNTEHVVTGVELKAIADRVSASLVEMALVSQEFENATMEITLNIPQSLNGRLYTIDAAPTEVTVATNDGQLEATSTTFKLDVLGVGVGGGPVDSSNERLRIVYDAGAITISGE